MTDQLIQGKSTTFKTLSEREGERKHTRRTCPNHRSDVCQCLSQNAQASCPPTDDLDPTLTYLNARWIRESHSPRWWIAAREPTGPNAVYAFLSLLHRPTMHGQIKTIIHIEEDTERARQVAPWLNGFPAPGVDFIQEIEASDATKGQIMGFRSRAMRIEPFHEAKCIKHTFKIVPFCLKKSKSKLSGLPVPADGQNIPDTDIEEFEKVAITIEHLVYYGWRRNQEPESSDKEPLRKFLELAESSMRRSGGKLNPSGPAIVMSAEGCKRVDSFIALASNSKTQSSRLKLQTQMDRASRIPGRH